MSFLSDVRAVVLEQGLGKARAQILTKQLQSKGGRADSTLCEATTHVLLGNNVRLSRVPHLLKAKALPESVKVLRADWLSACLVKGEKVDHASYTVRHEGSASPSLSPVKVGTSDSPKKGNSSVETVSKAKSSLQSERAVETSAPGGTEQEPVSTSPATRPQLSTSPPPQVHVTCVLCV